MRKKEIESKIFELEEEFNELENSGSLTGWGYQRIGEIQNELHQLREELKNFR